MALGFTLAQAPGGSDPGLPDASSRRRMAIPGADTRLMALRRSASTYLPAVRVVTAFVVMLIVFALLIAT